MSTVAQWLEEKGFKEGLEEAKQTIALRMLTEGLDEKLITKHTGLSKKEIESLQK